MSRKLLVPVQISTSQSLSSNFTSPITMVQYGDNISYQINIKTTDSQGSFEVQASNDYSPGTTEYPMTNAGNWTSLSLSGTPTVNAANDTILINMNQIPYKALRLSYISTTAGTGTCDILIGYKGLA